MVIVVVVSWGNLRHHLLIWDLGAVILLELAVSKEEIIRLGLVRVFANGWTLFLYHVFFRMLQATELARCVAVIVKNSAVVFTLIWLCYHTQSLGLVLKDKHLVEWLDHVLATMHLIEIVIVHLHFVSIGHYPTWQSIVTYVILSSSFGLRPAEVLCLFLSTTELFDAAR